MRGVFFWQGMFWPGILRSSKFSQIFYFFGSGGGKRYLSLNKGEKKEKKKKFSNDALLLLIIPHAHAKFMIVPTFWQFGNIFTMALFKTPISRIDILSDGVVETG